MAAINIDLEAQTGDMHATTLSTPAPALTHSTRVINPIDDFFGYTLSSSRTHESRHDRRISDVPPPYTEQLPPYTKKAETATLAQYLFKFGFLFPPFWILGAIILLSPLRAPASSVSPSSSWLPEKTEEERLEIIENMRKVEVKWARRCLWALMTLIFIGVAIGITVWAVKRS